ncbi:hypothetical protein PACTADRAFT_49307 [Pachysolen tannophilus NRRL Y-2460]|uniref:Enoyl reductase (ER) domain-containing protein n=1 Tax=Pachysolen tannophilus NRRL Y-2460 TaxID=669874 RepID=A0A1E4TVS6_PACTA|nr:hypothetical protein PACTADRAFT_49307 [Pachysolen tannophilus NRRL Y-2460]
MSGLMKALVYGGPGIRSWKSVPIPKLLRPTDAIVKLTSTTICGTDLHISAGDVPACKPGTILGHEGIGIIDSIGSDVKNFQKGDKVIISCITNCNSCFYCKNNLQSHCLDGGWILGYKIDGTQAEYVRIPHANSSLYKVPKSASDESLLMLSDILPTSYEIGVLSGKIKQGDSVAIVGAGPVGLSCLLTVSNFKPSKVIMIDLDDNRLAASRRFGATHAVNPKRVSSVKDEIEKITSDITAKRTNGVIPQDDLSGVDVAIECVGVPAAFDTCQEIIAPGGRIANVGVHGKKVDLRLQDLWIKNIGITTGLVSAFSTEELLSRILKGEIDSSKLVTHRFKMSEMEKAYEVFSNASSNGAIKTFIKADDA